MASPKWLQGENLKEAKRHVSAAHVVFIRAETKWQTLSLTVKMYVLLRTHSENHVDNHASVPLRYSYITHVTHADGGNIYTHTHAYTTGKTRNPSQNILQEQPKLTHKHI